MFFSVRDLEVKKIHFDVAFPAGEIDLLDPQIKQNGFLEASGVAELLSHALGEIRVRGHLRTEMVTTCDRCLDPAGHSIDCDFDLYYRAADTQPQEEELEIDEGESEIGFYEGDGLKLEDVLREYILLAIPMKLVCRPDCRGICPECGRNRNEAACDCRPRTADDRWEALRKLELEKL